MDTAMELNMIVTLSLSFSAETRADALRCMKKLVAENSGKTLVTVDGNRFVIPNGAAVVWASPGFLISNANGDYFHLHRPVAAIEEQK